MSELLGSKFAGVGALVDDGACVGSLLGARVGGCVGALLGARVGRRVGATAQLSVTP